MDQTIDANFCTSLSEPQSNNQLVKFKENPIRDISLLTKNFDLSSMPPNYMRRRSKIEEIIYRAIFSQNNHKSPFSSFNIAKDCLPELGKIDIVTGINNLKRVIRAIYSNNEQLSIMVHKIADTWLLDEFDLDALFLRHQYYADWDWLRRFIRHESFQLARPDLSRASLSMRDLYAKFLYHSVSQPSIEMPKIDQIDNESMSNQMSVFDRQPILNIESKHSTTTNQRFDGKNEDFLNLVDWKLEDLSFVVGSDLSIFGTKTHPCISLRLSPCHEPISILTGIDMWLENMLNEVPEIAMCYHDQGIVMREYEIFNTSDIPKLAAFDEDEVKSIAKNLSHFLSKNATKEGHTYWLFKEADNTTVKLYDLTTIYEKDRYKMRGDHHNDQKPPKPSHNSCDNNPFIVPVAVLCYKMAENRVNQWYRAREKRGKSKLTSSQYNKELFDNKLADNEFYFNEIFRLLKNCINLLMRTDKHRELVKKAMLMMCRLYLEVDQTTLNNLRYHNNRQHQSSDLDQLDRRIVQLDVSDLKKDDQAFSLSLKTLSLGSGNDLTAVPTTTKSAAFNNNNNYNHLTTVLAGSRLFDLCAEKKTLEIMEQAIKLIDIDDDLSMGLASILNSNKTMNNSNTVINNKTVKEPLLGAGNTLLSTQSTVNEIDINRSDDELFGLRLLKAVDNANRQLPIKSNLTYSLIMYYMGQSTTDIDLSTANGKELRKILKNGFMVALLDDEVLTDDVKLCLEHDFYYTLIGSFLRLHVDVDIDFASETDNQTSPLDNIDKKVLQYHYVSRDEQFMKAVLVFKSVFMSQKHRCQLNVNSALHVVWYQILVYLTSLAYRLSQLPMTKPKRNLIQRCMPIFLNFLVEAIIKVYQQKSNDKVLPNDVAANSASAAVSSSYQDASSDIVEWCKKIVLGSVKWISNWTELENFDTNLEPGLVALVWSNKAKLYRLTAAILGDNDYNYLAIDSYGVAIDTLMKSGKNKKPPSQMAVNIKCDRLDVCLLIVENVYSQFSAAKNTASGKQDEQLIQKMHKAMEYAEKFHRLESSLQSIVPPINVKLISLRLRINFVRYYLNLKANQYLNYDQILFDLKSDLNLILKREDSLAQCREIILVQFYLFKIQSDRFEILSLGAMKKFLTENLPILRKCLQNERNHAFFHNDGKSLLSGIRQDLVAMLNTFIRKCKPESSRKKKQETVNSAKIDSLKLYLEQHINDQCQLKSTNGCNDDDLGSVQSMEKLLLEIETSLL